MKIAVISPSIPSLNSYKGMLGGGENYVFELSKSIAQKGNEITLFTTSKNETIDFSFSNNLKIKYYKLSYGKDANFLSIDLMREILTNKFDILHIHQLSTINSLCSNLCGKLSKIPVVVTDHGGGWELLNSIPFFTTQLPDLIAAVSYFSLKTLLRFVPQKKSLILYGGVNTNIFKNIKQVNDIRNKYNLKDSRIILFVGRLLPVKGVDLLIRTLPELPKDVKLLIVGRIFDEQYFDFIKNLIPFRLQDRVVFTGSVELDELPYLFNLCDVYVQPSVHFDYSGHYHRVPELLGLAKLEAMACGKPVVVSDVGGLPENIIDGWNGRIFKASDKKELLKALIEILNNESLKKQMGKNGQNLVRTKYTWNAVAERAIKSYELAKR